MRRMVQVAVIFATLASTRPSPCSAQAPVPRALDPVNGLTLAEAIAEGLRAEPGLRAARLDIEAARGDQRQAGLRPNPGVSFDEREQARGMDRQTTIMVELPLDPFRRGARIDTAARTVAAAEAAVLDRERLLASAIRERYGAVAIAVRRVEIMDAVLAASRRTYELLRTRAEEGAAPPLDRDISLVELRRLEGERERTAGAVLSALAELKPLLGRPQAAAVTLRESLETLVQQTDAGDPPAGSGERADVREAAALVTVAQARTHEAAQEGKPDITLFGGYMRMAAGFPQRAFGPSDALVPIQGVFHNVTAGVRVSVPVFNRGQGAIAAAQAREAAASHLLTARQLAAGSELASAAARVEAARRAMTPYAGDTRRLAQQNLEVVRETYTLGRATLFDVLGEQRRFLEFETAFTEILADVWSAQTALRRATGERQ